MTTNPGPEYFLAQERYDQAKTTQQKIAALTEMIKYCPKHKASEKLVAELTYKLARLKQESDKEKVQQSKRGGGASINVKKDGAGQIVILGAPNSGKSYLLKMLTGVDVEIAEYPFTTTKPEIGMMGYRGTQVQVVEVPALIEGSSEGKANGTQLLSLARNADAIIVMHRDDAEKGMVVGELAKAGIIITRKKPRIAILPNSEYQGITVAGKQFLKISEKELEDTLKRAGIYKASVLLEEDTDLGKLTEALDESLDYKNALFIKTGSEGNLDELKAKIFGLLEKIIVYTKKPGAEADLNTPMCVKEGSTVSDIAGLVHKEMADRVKYAKVWGSSKLEVQRVGKEYRLKDGDIVDISA
ncbi:GTPase Obg [uncultured archaeon]|nr:GTPase Obg [uncultured archaeon]